MTATDICEIQENLIAFAEGKPDELKNVFFAKIFPH